MKSDLLAIRQGSCIVKVRRKDVRRLPIIDEIVTDDRESRLFIENRLVNLGQLLSSIPDGWLVRAAEWASTDAKDYVLPTDPEKALETQLSLRYYGVDETIIMNLKTAASLRDEITRLEESEKRLTEDNAKLLQRIEDDHHAIEERLMAHVEVRLQQALDDQALEERLQALEERLMARFEGRIQALEEGAGF